MLKRFFLNIILLAGFIAGNAQTVPGTWREIPMSGSYFEFVQDTPDKVYGLSGGMLYSFDKNDNERIYYGPGSKISDSTIKFIKYNGNKKYLAIIYTNGNIDLLYDNGKVVNLPEIKDATITANKSINNVQFGDGRMYVASSFGIVVFDDVNHHVVESGIYNENIPFAFELGNNIMIIYNNQLMYSPKTDRHNSISKFISLGNPGVTENIYAVSPTEFISVANSKLQKYSVDLDRNTFSIVSDQNVTKNNTIKQYKDGFYVCGSDGFYLFDKNGDYVSKEAYASNYASKNISFWNSPASAWVSDTSSFSNYDFVKKQALSSNMFPQETSKQFYTWYAEPMPDGRQVYISECARSEFFPNVGADNQFMSKYMTHEIYNWDTGTITPHHLRNPWGTISFGSNRVIFDLEEPEVLYVGSPYWGLTGFRGLDQICQFDENNSPLITGWGSGIYDLAFDNNGNLWVMMWRADGTERPYSSMTPVKVLPKESLKVLRSDASEITKATVDGDGNKIDYPYWLQPKWIDGYLAKYDAKIIFSRTTNKGITSSGGWGSNIIGIDTKGTTKVDDDVYHAFNGLLDQDGTVSDPIYIGCLIEDKKGDIWMGTDIGVFVIKDLDQIGDLAHNYLNVVRPKVARNDGTNYADYLLSSDFVLNIATDPQNRKWIATSTSGLYCVSEDGTRIIHEFNKDNSPLVSNQVTMVTCDPNGNDILIGTPQGLFVYSSESAPAKDDYSEVYAAPNPVRPDYSGWITINGLMDNSLVKITDSMGHLVFQTRSEGGMAVWDGCDSSGNRVRSGVYMVFASENENDSSSGAVTKIVVIN